MKKLQILLLAILSTLLFIGCDLNQGSSSDTVEKISLTDDLGFSNIKSYDTPGNLLSYESSGTSGYSLDLKFYSDTGSILTEEDYEAVEGDDLDKNGEAALALEGSDYYESQSGVVSYSTNEVTFTEVLMRSSSTGSEIILSGTLKITE